MSRFFFATLALVAPYAVLKAIGRRKIVTAAAESQPHSRRLDSQCQNSCINCCAVVFARVVQWRSSAATLLRPLAERVAATKSYKRLNRYRFLVAILDNHPMKHPTFDADVDSDVDLAGTLTDGQRTALLIGAR